MKGTVSTGIGETLRAAREEQGRSLEDAAQAVRARIGQLEALEQERFEDFGGDVYAKGFLRSYALELGLDPGPLLEIYRREIGHDDAHATALVGGVAAPPREPMALPTWVVWLFAAVVVVAGLAFLGMLGTGSAPPTADDADPPSPPPSPAEDVDDPDADEDPADDEVIEEPDPEPEPPDGVEVLIALEEASWLRVVVDGTPVLEETVPAGETRQYRGEREIEIRYGNPGGVHAELNGEDLGPQGTRGQPVTVRYTLDGVEPV